jgi:hypothetical protein
MVEGGGWSVEGGWRAEGGGWRVEGGGWRWGWRGRRVGAPEFLLLQDMFLLQGGQIFLKGRILLGKTLN